MAGGGGELRQAKESRGWVGSIGRGGQSVGQPAAESNCDGDLGLDRSASLSQVVQGIYMQSLVD